MSLCGNGLKPTDIAFTQGHTTLLLKPISNKPYKISWPSHIKVLADDSPMCFFFSPFKEGGRVQHITRYKVNAGIWDFLLFNNVSKVIFLRVLK